MLATACMGGRKKPNNNVPQLDADLWPVVAGYITLVSTLRTLALVCREARDGVKIATFDAPLRRIEDKMMQKFITHNLCVTADFCRENMQFVCDLDAGSYNHTYEIGEILRAFGGWERVSKALHKRLILNRQLVDLNKRRAFASKARRGVLNLWIEKERPFGDKLVSIAAIERALEQQRPLAAPLTFNPILCAFLGSTLSSPRLTLVKLALKDHVVEKLIKAKSNALAAFV